MPTDPQPAYTEQPQTEQPQTEEHGPLGDNPFVSFAPWIIFSVVAGPSTWEAASVSALLAAVLLLVIDMDVAPVIDAVVDRTAGLTPDSRTRVRLKMPKYLDLGTVVFFAVFSLLGALISRSALIQLEHYAQAISSGGLAVMVLFTLAIGHPFTEQYARESVPKEYWHLPSFRRTNVVLTSMWGVIFVLTAGLGVAAESGVSSSVANWLNWYIPIILLVAGIRANSWYPAQVSARTQDGRPRPAETVVAR